MIAGQDESGILGGLGIEFLFLVLQLCRVREK